MGEVLEWERIDVLPTSAGTVESLTGPCLDAPCLDAVYGYGA
jgi:hypothetical protein